MNWQHVIPQREPWDCDPITPMRGPDFGRPVCNKCGEPIKQVDENEGPESLKAMFRF